MTLLGTIVNGQIVLDQPHALPEGAKVKIEIEKATELLEPRDEWEQRLRSIAVDCGVSLSNEAVSSEGIHD